MIVVGLGLTKEVRSVVGVLDGRNAVVGPGDVSSAERLRRLGVNSSNRARPFTTGTSTQRSGQSPCFGRQIPPGETYPRTTAGPRGCRVNGQTDSRRGGERASAHRSVRAAAEPLVVFSLCADWSRGESVRPALHDVGRVIRPTSMSGRAAWTTPRSSRISVRHVKTGRFAGRAILGLRRLCEVRSRVLVSLLSRTPMPPPGSPPELRRRLVVASDRLTHLSSCEDVRVDHPPDRKSRSQTLDTPVSLPTS